MLQLGFGPPLGTVYNKPAVQPTVTPRPVSMEDTTIKAQTNKVAVAAMSTSSADETPRLSSVSHMPPPTSLADGVNALGEGGLNTFMRAVLTNQVGLGKVLIMAGANPDLVSGSGRTALHLSVLKGYREMTQWLLSLKVQVDARDKQRWTPLMRSIQRGDNAIVWDLLNYKADVNATALKAVTPLMVAAAYNNEAAALTLLQLGVSIDSRDRSGKTALMLAAVRGHRACVRVLLSTGASTTITNAEGLTARELAIKNDHDTVAAMFPSVPLVLSRKEVVAAAGLMQLSRSSGASGMECN